MSRAATTASRLTASASSPVSRTAVGGEPGRDHPGHVGVLAGGQPGGDGAGAGGEPGHGRGAVGAGQHVHPDRVVSGVPGHVGEGGCGDQDRRRQPGAGWLPGQFAERGPVPVGRHHGDRIGGEGDLDGAQSGQRVVPGRGDHDLPDGGGELGGVGLPGRGG